MFFRKNQLNLCTGFDAKDQRFYIIKNFYRIFFIALINIYFSARNFFIWPCYFKRKKMLWLDTNQITARYRITQFFIGFTCNPVGPSNEAALEFVPQRKLLRERYRIRWCNKIAWGNFELTSSKLTVNYLGRGMILLLRSLNSRCAR